MKGLTYLKYCFLVFPMLLGGCITSSTQPRMEELPVYTKKIPPPLEMPELQVDFLVKPYTDKQGLKALGMDHATLRKKLEECITVLDGYR